jgi:23S rRNA (cytosine1962-C5)-methyltransferase
VGAVILKAGHVQPVWAGHPWVFAQAVERIEGGVAAGDEVEVRDPRGQVLGRGLYSPGSAIPVRLYTRDRDRAIDASLIVERIERAVARRAMFGLPSADTNAYRVVHAEGDDLPGIIIDRLGDVYSIQLSTIGVNRREAAVLEALSKLGPRAIVDRTPERAARTEGFEPRSGVIHGDTAVTAFEFRERGLSFRIPLELKTLVNRLW